jgi:hypothetical protein
MPAPAGAGPRLPPLRLQAPDQTGDQAPLRPSSACSGGEFRIAERPFPSRVRRPSRTAVAHFSLAVGGMFRTIAAAGIVFAFAAFALRHSTVVGALEEPLLLLFMGTLFLIVGKVFSASGKKVSARPAAQLVERRA